MSEQISDEMLTAYVDGQLDDAERVKVAKALEADAELRGRMEALEFPVDAMRSAFGGLLIDAPQMPDLPATPDRRGRFGSLGVAAALVLGVGIGSVLSLGLGRSSDTDWMTAVADYQVLYVTETLTASAPDTDGGAMRVAALSQQLGRDLSAALDVEGVEFRRAQMLGLNGSPLVQMAYLAPGGVPVAICVTKIGEPDRSVSTGVLQGLASAHWVSGGYGFLVIGGEDVGFVGQIARDVAARI